MTDTDRTIIQITTCLDAIRLALVVIDTYKADDRDAWEEYQDLRETLVYHDEKLRLAGRRHGLDC